VSVTAALALSCLVLKVRYKIVHIVGVSVCLMGVGCLVWADIDDGRSLTGGKFPQYATVYCSFLCTCMQIFLFNPIYAF
jgi:Eukaryotic protein of unknown function (DUF914).